MRRTLKALGIAVLWVGLAHWAYWQWASPVRYESYGDVIRSHFATLPAATALFAAWATVAFASGIFAWEGATRFVSIQEQALRPRLVWVGFWFGCLVWLVGLDLLSQLVTGRGVL